MNKFYDEAIEKTLQLLAVDSVQATACKSSPFGKGVGECIDLFLQWLQESGFVVHNEQGYYGTAEIGEGQEFGILGHVDTVPYENDWSVSPLGEIKDDKIYGRGVLDDKGPMVCCLVACKQLLNEGYLPTKKIRFIVGGNEESGWKCIEKFNELDTMPVEGFSPDGDFPVINCEKGLVHYLITMPMPEGLISLEGGSRGNIVMASCKAVVNSAVVACNYDSNLKMEVCRNSTTISGVGKPAHASTPSKGVNALWSCLGYLSRELGGEYTILHNYFCHNDGVPLGLDLYDEKSGKLTFNTGVVKTIEEDGKKFLQFTVDIRFPVSYDKQEIMEKIRKKIGCLDIKIANFHDPHYIAPDNKLVKGLLGAYNEVMEENAKPISIGGGTYARALKCGVAFGPMFANQESTIHQKDENCELSYFKKMYDIYYTAIKNILFKKR